MLETISFQTGPFNAGNTETRLIFPTVQRFKQGENKAGNFKQKKANRGTRFSSLALFWFSDPGLIVKLGLSQSFFFNLFFLVKQKSFRLQSYMGNFVFFLENLSCFFQNSRPILKSFNL